MRLGAGYARRAPSVGISGPNLPLSGIAKTKIVANEVRNAWTESARLAMMKMMNDTELTGTVLVGNIGLSVKRIVILLFLSDPDSGSPGGVGT